MDFAVIVSIAIFLVTFLFILTERIHRTVIALVGAIMMIMVGTIFNFYNLDAAIEAIDFNVSRLYYKDGDWCYKVFKLYVDKRN